MAKTRVSYPKELRSEAGATQRGLATVSLTMPNGERLEEQATLDPQQCMFLKWAMAMIFCPEVRQLPDLEATVRGLMENQR